MSSRYCSGRTFNRGLRAQHERLLPRCSSLKAHCTTTFPTKKRLWGVIESLARRQMFERAAVVRRTLWRMAAIAADLFATHRDFCDGDDRNAIWKRVRSTPESGSSK